MWSSSRNGSDSASDIAPGNGRRTLNPAPSSWRFAVITLAIGRGVDAAGSGRGIRGRTSVSSTVMAGMRSAPGSRDQARQSCRVVAVDAPTRRDGHSTNSRRRRDDSCAPRARRRRRPRAGNAGSADDDPIARRASEHLGRVDLLGLRGRHDELAERGGAGDVGVVVRAAVEVGAEGLDAIVA